MGRVYVTRFKDIEVSALQDLFSLLPGVDKPVLLHACFISQSSDFKDAAEEGLLISVVRGNTTVGSGGAAATGEGLGSTNTAADAASIRVNDTTEASSGTEVELHLETWNIRQTWIYHPAPEDRPGVENADFICIRLLDTPADALTCSGTLIYEELI